MHVAVKGILCFLILGVCAFLIVHMTIGFCTISSQSMEPGLQEGAGILVNKMAYNFNEPDRGEVVYYQSPDDGIVQIKRVIGIAGDFIEIKNRSVYVNNIKLDEPYVKNLANYDLPSFQIPPSNYFLLGDNRSDTSVYSGLTVSRDNILGRAWVLTWPPDKWGEVDHYPLNIELAAAEESFN